MPPRYRKHLDEIRREFPQPVSDPVHDAYAVFSILRALNQVDELKSRAPILGSPVEPDYDAARAARVAEGQQPLEQVIPQLVSFLEGMFIWGHPRSQINVVPYPSLASIIGVLLPSIYNPNLCSDESSRRLAEAEVRAVAMTAAMIGYDAERSAGVFTFGGTGTLLYGVKIGLEKAVAGCLERGLREPAVLLCSDQSHYATKSVAAWLGIGQDNVVRVPTHPDNSIKLGELAIAARKAIESGQRIAAIVATMGSTDAFGIDDLEGIVALRDELVEEFQLDYRPHIHADAVIGWAWSVFNDYDYERNDLDFRGRTVRALAAAQYRIQHLALADSLGVDFHKTAYVPYISSMVLVKDAHDFKYVARARDSMPYLYQSGDYHPGMFTLETSRSATGPMAALANLLLLGKEGLRTLLGHAVEMAEVLREKIESHPDVTVLNGDNVGPVTLFRVYPHGTNTFTIKDRERSDPKFRDQLLAHNAYNRRIFEQVQGEAISGRGVVISMTDCYRMSEYGVPISALKSYVLSPFADETRMQSVLTHVLQARDAVEKADRATP
jgi:L-2,4-diaminobutyrate decarboxylase